MKSRSLVIALLASALLVRAPLAHAAPPVPLAQALHGEAHDAYESGRALFKGGDFAAALASFERAYAATPDPRLLWNMAACERRLGHDARVLSLVARYLVEGGALLTEEDRREAERFVTAVRARVAVLGVTTDPPGARVRIDGASVGETPLTDPVFLDAGTHHIEVAKDGYVSVARDETVSAGERRSLTVGLQPVPAAPPPAEEPAETPPDSGGLAVTVVPPAPPPPPPEPSSRGPAIVVGSAGVFALVVGGALVLEASSSYDRIQKQCAPNCDRSTWRGAQTREIVGDVLLGVGAAAVATGVVWWVASNHHAGSVGLSLTPAGASVHGRW